MVKSRIKLSADPTAMTSPAGEKPSTTLDKQGMRQGHMVGQRRAHIPVVHVLRCTPGCGREGKRKKRLPTGHGDM